MEMLQVDRVVLTWIFFASLQVLVHQKVFIIQSPVVFYRPGVDEAALQTKLLMKEGVTLQLS